MASAPCPWQGADLQETEFVGEVARMTATTDAVVRRLGAGGGLLFRYLPDESPDGLADDEGAFVLCSFWLVDNLAGRGRLDEAEDLFESLCARASPLGLLLEQINPGTGAHPGSYFPAFSHVGLISSAINLVRRTGRTATPGQVWKKRPREGSIR